MQSSEIAQSPLENEEIPKRTLECTPSATLQPTLLAPASNFTQQTAQQAQPKNAKITVED